MGGLWGRMMGTVLVTIAAAAAAIPPHPVPVPSVETLPVTAASHPFLGAAWQREPIDLAAHGYVEKEFVLRGKANVYAYAADKSVLIETADAPYANRILVRMPADPKKFNGRILVDLLNASGGADASFQWTNMAFFLMAEGYGYVGVTSKPIAINRLKAFDASRYAALSWANPAAVERRCANPGPAGLFPGWSTPATEDGLLWDIAAQVGALLQSAGPANPFHGYKVDALYLSGHSQSGAYVGQYARDFQTILRLANGRPVYDGFLQTGSSGLSMINQCTPALPYSDPHVVMRSATPLIRVMTLTDFYLYTPITPYLLRRPDGDTPGDRFRLYEAAGAEHVSAEARKYNASDADSMRAGSPPHGPAVCVETIPSDFPIGPIFDVALEHLDAWRRGTSPPHAVGVLVDKPGDPSAKPVLDADGNVQGGVRTPAIDVPVASYAGKSQPAPPDMSAACRNQGHKFPFSPARLHTLYPTHAAYVAKVEASVMELHQARWLTDWDSRRIVADARANRIPD